MLLKKQTAFGCLCQGEYCLEPLSDSERQRLLERRLDRDEPKGAIRPQVMMRLLQQYEVTVHARDAEIARLCTALNRYADANNWYGEKEGTDDYVAGVHADAGTLLTWDGEDDGPALARATLKDSE